MPYIVKGGNGKYLKKFKFAPPIIKSKRKSIYSDAFWTDDPYSAIKFKRINVAQRCAKIYNGEFFEILDDNFDT